MTSTPEPSSAAPELPPYPGLDLAQIHLVQSPTERDAALAQLLAAEAVGFDTESKPTFRKGEESTGPHLLQLALADRAWLFPLTQGIDLAPFKPLLESATVLKIGFGLKDDVKRLAGKYGVAMQGVVDLSVALRGVQRQDFGAKTAVAHFFGQKLLKSKKISTTNWSRLPYSPGQLRYAATDAQVPLMVYREWLRQKADGTWIAKTAPTAKVPTIAP
jgi:RNA polymerase sigma factor for flagellar operon FliA